MREMFVREANQNVSQVIAAAEARRDHSYQPKRQAGGWVMSQTTDRAAEPAWAAAHGRPRTKPEAAADAGFFWDDHRRRSLRRRYLMHVANASGARALRTEDRRDRRTVDVWRIINPFIAASNRIVGETLGP